MSTRFIVNVKEGIELIRDGFNIYYPYDEPFAEEIDCIAKRSYGILIGEHCELYEEYSSYWIYSDKLATRPNNTPYDHFCIFPDEGSVIAYMTLRLNKYLKSAVEREMKKP